MKAVFLDAATFPDEQTLTPPAAVTDWQTFGKTQPDQRLARLHRADIAIVNKVVLDAPLLSQLPNLKCIGVTATGINNVDLEFCRTRGIAVFNATGYAVDAVGEHCIMVMLALARNLKAYLQDADDKGWSRSPFFCNRVAPIDTLSGKRLVIVGKGDLGSAVASRAQAMGLSVVYAERPGATSVRPGYTDFETALSVADVLSLHCPLTDQTEGMINRHTLTLMQSHALLINSGRGDLIVEEDLLDALTQGQIGAAALDVASSEPPPEDHVIWQLAALPNVIVTPHVAWSSAGAMATLLRQLEDKLTRWARQEPDALAASLSHSAD
ncbi:D-2-hydroxyacid dehydrogenase [Saccharospirillum impatiens]|uniref:D-2-hydroxyacid dehydrogenase n=1 Tax=Saccharospirillum impatiens TaxID=169438 RepID=UPI000407F73B|nr:D-2-hydroxyacid dehydrogenase [Saccharospirillum impatiens]